jgi:hypothetical protein
MGSRWRKSSRSQGNGGNCVEARTTGRGFEVRDSKLGEDSPVFGVESTDFQSLLRAARR